MEKPTKALLPEIFNTKTDEDFAKVIGGSSDSLCQFNC